LPPGGHLSTLWPSSSATPVSRKLVFHHLRARRASWQPTGVLSAISAEVSGLISLYRVVMEFATRPAPDPVRLRRAPDASGESPMALVCETVAHPDRWC